MEAIWIVSIFLGLLMVVEIRKPRVKSAIEAKRWSGVILITAGAVGFLAMPTNPTNWALVLMTLGFIGFGCALVVACHRLTRRNRHDY